MDPHTIATSLLTVSGLGLLEAVLSADNAIALAALVRHVEPAERRAQALNGGMALAFLLRALMILLASWILRYAIVQLLGGAYLLWLACCHFQAQWHTDRANDQVKEAEPLPLLRMIGLLGMTDLAFSLDSVTAAMGLSQQLGLVIAGGAMGVLFLRCSAGYFLRWLDAFVHLENAAYLSVLAVGLRLVGQVLLPALVPSETAITLMMAVFFAWGFSRRQDPQLLPDGLGR